METKEKQQELIKYIQTEIPEIMELKFGCEILRYIKFPDERKYKVIVDIGWGANAKVVWLNSVPFGSMSMSIELLKSELGDKTGDWKIIGRPITLLDCKQCLVYNNTTDNELLEIVKLWEKPNDLTKQSEELINKLYEKFKDKIC